MQVLDHQDRRDPAARGRRDRLPDRCKQHGSRRLHRWFAVGSTAYRGMRTPPRHYVPIGARPDLARRIIRRRKSSHDVGTSI